VCAGGGDESVGGALRCKCGDKQDEGNREAQTAQHGIDYAAPGARGRQPPPINAS